MIQTFTRNDVLRYVFSEMSEEENEGMKNALMTNSELYTLYRSITETNSLVQKIDLVPSESTIDNIIEYSLSVRVTLGNN